MSDAPLTIAGREFRSRLMVGTGKYKTLDLMHRAIEASGAEVVTVAVRRVDLDRTNAEGVLAHLDPTQVFGTIFQYPGTFGHIPDLREPIASLNAAGAISIIAADPLALTLLTPPGELGADIMDRALAPSSLVTALFVFPLIKALHELGHGWAVKRWGGEKLAQTLRQTVEFFREKLK